MECTLGSLRAQQAAQRIRGVLDQVGLFDDAGSYEGRVEEMAAVECVVPVDQVLASLSQHSRLTLAFGVPGPRASESPFHHLNYSLSRYLTHYLT